MFFFKQNTAYEMRISDWSSDVCSSDLVRHVFFSAQSADLKDSASAKAVADRQEAWKSDLPKDEDALWDWLAALDDASRAALLAPCVSFGVNALYEKVDRYEPGAASAHGVLPHGSESVGGSECQYENISG